MAFIDAYNTIKKYLRARKADKIEGHLAIQLRLTDEDASGIMYLEVNDKKLYIEPYDYFDRDAEIVATSKDFLEVMNAGVDFEKAVEEGKILIYGDVEKAKLIKALIKKPTTRKPAAKKATAAKTTAKNSKK